MGKESIDMHRRLDSQWPTACKVHFLARVKVPSIYDASTEIYILQPALSLCADDHSQPQT